MPDLQINYDAMDQLEKSLMQSAINFHEASEELGKVIKLAAEDVLDGEAAELITASLINLQSKLESASSRFGTLNEGVRKATEEIRERDNAIKF